MFKLLLLSVLGIVAPGTLTIEQVVVIGFIATLLLWGFKLLQARTGTVLTPDQVAWIALAVSAVLAVFWLWADIVAAFTGVVDPVQILTVFAAVVAAVTGFAIVIDQLLLSKLVAKFLPGLSPKDVAKKVAQKKGLKAPV
jgi:hypothetical protein